MKVNQTTNICPRLKPVQLPLVGKWVSINSATRIFCRKAMMTGISSVRSWVIVICSLIPRAYLNSYFLAKIRTNCELSAIVYRPEHLQEVDRHHRQIMKKTCVVSALDDQLHTIKTYMGNAAHKQGLSQATTVTALADGAQNCWSVLAAIQRECATFECILDWFHIAQKFQQVKNVLGEAFAASLESAKWKLWHGHADDALTKLAVLRDHVPDERQRSKLTGLYEYLHRNQAYLVNYDTRAQANKTYTSQVAESHIDTLINARHKRTKKMQWTREGAHHVLQIRAMMASDEWESKGQGAILLALGAVA